MDLSEDQVKMEAVRLQIRELIEKMMKETDEKKSDEIDEKIDKLEKIELDLLSEYLRKGFNFIIYINYHT